MQDQNSAVLEGVLYENARMTVGNAVDGALAFDDRHRDASCVAVRTSPFVGLCDDLLAVHFSRTNQPANKIRCEFRHQRSIITPGEASSILRLSCANLQRRPDVGFDIGLHLDPLSDSMALQPSGTTYFVFDDSFFVLCVCWWWVEACNSCSRLDSPLVGQRSMSPSVSIPTSELYTSIQTTKIVV